MGMICHCLPVAEGLPPGAYAIGRHPAGKWFISWPNLLGKPDLPPKNVPELFARNRRVACIFDLERGPVAVVLVGALIVASVKRFGRAW